MVCIDHLEEHFFEARTLDCNLVASSLVDETFHNSPDTREQVGSVDHIQVAHDLWVVVATNLGCKLNELLNLAVEGAHPHASQVHNGKTLLNPSTSEFRASRVS